MSGLGGERVRWGEISESLGPKYNNLLGDVLLSSGVIAYLGPFTIPYRDEAIAQWQAPCTEKRCRMSDVSTCRRSWATRSRSARGTCRGCPPTPSRSTTASSRRSRAAGR